MWDTTALTLWLSTHQRHLTVNIGGIPHLAKNERDMGHPALAWESGLRRGESELSLPFPTHRPCSIVEDGLEQNAFASPSFIVSPRPIKPRPLRLTGRNCPWRGCYPCQAGRSSKAEQLWHRADESAATGQSA